MTDLKSLINSYLSDEHADPTYLKLIGDLMEDHDVGNDVMVFGWPKQLQKHGVIWFEFDAPVAVMIEAATKQMPVRDWLRCLRVSSHRCYKDKYPGHCSKFVHKGHSYSWAAIREPWYPMACMIAVAQFTCSDNTRTIAQHRLRRLVSIVLHRLGIHDRFRLDDRDGLNEPPMVC